MILRRFAKPVRLLLFAVLLVPWTIPPCAAEDGPETPGSPKSILFVGNSFTFYNNAIYTHLRGLLEAEDPSLRGSIFLKSMTISGAVLGDHEGGLGQMLELRSWDTVVLQGHSREAIEPGRRTGLVKTAGRFGDAIRARGARPVLFMTWAYADRPEMTPELLKAFTEIGQELDMMVVPVGLAFDDALESIPGLGLHHADRKHPSLEGTYLSACVFYAALFGKSPAGIGYDAGLDEKLALQLQESAWVTVTRYYQEQP